MLVFIFHLFL